MKITLYTVCIWALGMWLLELLNIPSIIHCIQCHWFIKDIGCQQNPPFCSPPPLPAGPIVEAPVPLLDWTSMACMSVRLWRLCRRSSTQRRVSKKERMTCANPLRCLLSQLKLFCPKLLVHDTLPSTILDCSSCYSLSNLITCYICLSVHDHHPTSPVQELRSRWWPGEVVIARDKWPGSNQLSLASLNAATTSKPALCRHSLTGTYASKLAI